jgi:hypothetical protein
MKLSSLKSYAISKISRASTVLGLSLLMAVASSKFYYDASAKSEQREQALQLVKMGLINMEQEIKKAEEALKIWSEIKDQHKKLNGLEIESAKFVMDKLKLQNSLTSMQVNLSNPEPWPTEFTTTQVEVMNSDVKIGFSTFKDADTFNFLYDIARNLPGYVLIDNISISAIDRITEEDIIKIKAGQLNKVITADVNFKWLDFKQKTEEESANG